MNHSFRSLSPPGIGETYPQKDGQNVIRNGLKSFFLQSCIRLNAAMMLMGVLCSPLIDSRNASEEINSFLSINYCSSKSGRVQWRFNRNLCSLLLVDDDSLSIRSGRRKVFDLFFPNHLRERTPFDSQQKIRCYRKYSEIRVQSDASMTSGH